METVLQWHIISQHQQHLQLVVNHYENSYLPELREYSGRSQAEHLQSAIEKQQQFNNAVNDFRITGHWLYIESEISRGEICNYIRGYAIECKEMADNWPENSLIVMRSLRECIKTIAVLKNLLPAIDCYSNKAIASRIRIKIA